jgi:hypothetical protein
MMAVMHEGNDLDAEGFLLPTERKPIRMRRIDERTVELTDEEELVHELYNIQLDRGHGCAEALVVLAGYDVPPGLRSETPKLNAVLTPEFSQWLTR